MSDYSEDEDGQYQFPFMVKPEEPRKSANRITDWVKGRIFELRSFGHIQSDIAAMLGLNQGRVSEVLRGLR